MSDALFARQDLFVTGFDISPDWELPPEFDPKDYNGLALYQRIRNAGATEAVLIWWADSRYYNEVWARKLATKFKLPLSPSFSGTATERQPAEKPFWSQPKKWGPWMWGLVGVLAALAGNFTQVENFVIAKSAVPHIDVQPNPVATRMILEQQGTVDFKIHNRSLGPCRIRQLVAEPANEKDMTVDSDIGPLTSLEPGEFRTVSIAVVPHSTGKKKIMVSGLAKAGFFRTAKLTPVPLEIDVWDQLQSSPPVRVESPFEKDAIFVVEAHHGKPLGRMIEYQATASDHLVFTRLEGGDNASPIDPVNGSIAVTWKKEATPMVPQIFRLGVHAPQNASKEQWQQYEKSIKIDTALARDH